MPTSVDFALKSLYFVDNVNLFGKLGGFDHLLAFPDPALSLKKDLPVDKTKSSPATVGADGKPQERKAPAPPTAEDMPINKYVERVQFVLRVLDSVSIV